MKTQPKPLLIALALLSTFGYQLSAQPQGTAFTYQGRLLFNGTPATGIYDLEFYLRDAESGGNPVGSTNIQPALAVSNGLFSAALDFGAGIFTGPQRWLEIGARTNGSISAYTVMEPRQGLTPSPSALYAPVSASAVSAPQLNTTTVPSPGQVLAFDGTSLAWTNPASASSGGWLLTGNSGTSPASNFLGTTDGQSLELRALGGINLNSGTNRVSLAGQPGLEFGNTTRQMINLYQSAYAIGVQNLTTYFRSASDFSWHMGGSHTNLQNDPGPGGYEMMRLDGNGDLNVRKNVIANSVTLSSDRNLKENFQPINPVEVLEKVAALPITFWNFKESCAVRHVGPTAQDFYGTFGLGGDDRHIAVVDEGGVALAAIQGVEQKLREKDAQIQKLTEQVEALTRAVRQVQAVAAARKTADLPPEE